MNRSKAVSITAMLLMTSSAYAEGCQYDTQCKGDRVCQRGECVAPGSGATGNPTTENGKSTDGLSSTCKFTSGPKAGQVQHWPRSTPGLRPAKPGLPCTDGAGSSGVAIPD